MKILETISQVQEWRSNQDGKQIALVPTMGALHAGHRSLLDRARQENDLLALSIFVNPTQFAENEDLDQYPKPKQEDIRIAEEAGVDCLWFGNKQDCYPPGFSTSIKLEKLSGLLCGKSRTQHFDGVAVIVLKLLNIFQPYSSYFGEKDFQQLRIIQQLVTDLNLACKIVPCPIVRESSGLALSSRNQYLKAEGRQEAKALYACLQHLQALALAGENECKKLIQAGLGYLENYEGIEVEYLEIVNSLDLQGIETLDPNFSARVLIAARHEGVRLIDNVSIDCKGN